MTGTDRRREGVRQGVTREVYGETHPWMGEQEVQEGEREAVG